MGKEVRQAAYERLIQLSKEKGYITFDDVESCTGDFSLPIQDVDWLSSSLMRMGVILYEEEPQNIGEEEYDDYAQSDYGPIYKRIIELDPPLQPFVDVVQKIIPPQRLEINKLKYQVAEGNIFARKRCIEMYLRLALKIALQRAELYDLDIAETIENACIGLIIGVDKYDPSNTKPFSSHVSMWIFQNISREQSTKRELVYYPVHMREKYFSVYPVLKRKGYVENGKLHDYHKAIQVVETVLQCSRNQAQSVIQMCIPDEYLESSQVAEAYLSEDYKLWDAELAAERKSLLCAVMGTLTERERLVLRLRYGFNEEPKTLEEVGQIIGVTRERIRQIEKKALSRLKRMHDIKGL